MTRGGWSQLYTDGPGAPSDDGGLVDSPKLTNFSRLLKVGEQVQTGEIDTSLL